MRSSPCVLQKTPLTLLPDSLTRCLVCPRVPAGAWQTTQEHGPGESKVASPSGELTYIVSQPARHHFSQRGLPKIATTRPIRSRIAERTEWCFSDHEASGRSMPSKGEAHRKNTGAPQANSRSPSHERSDEQRIRQANCPGSVRRTAPETSGEQPRRRLANSPGTLRRTAPERRGPLTLLLLLLLLLRPPTLTLNPNPKPEP